MALSNNASSSSPLFDGETQRKGGKIAVPGDIHFLVGNNATTGSQLQSPLYFNKTRRLRGTSHRNPFSEI